MENMSRFRAASSPDLFPFLLNSQNNRQDRSDDLSLEGGLLDYILYNLIGMHIISFRFFLFFVFSHRFENCTLH